MALDGVTSFLCLKVFFWGGGGGGGSSSVQWRKLKEAEDFKCVFVAYCVLESK